MTANQLQYWSLKETQRSNMAREQENARANTETQRANKAKEAETYRSNVAKEGETHRHNVQNEAIDSFKAATSGIKDITSSAGNLLGVFA